VNPAVRRPGTSSGPVVVWTPLSAMATRIARPTAEPICWVVEAMAEAMPWWRASIGSGEHTAVAQEVGGTAAKEQEATEGDRVAADDPP